MKIPLEMILFYFYWKVDLQEMMVHVSNYEINLNINTNVRLCYYFVLNSLYQHLTLTFFTIPTILLELEVLPAVSRDLCLFFGSTVDIS